MGMGSGELTLIGVFLAFVGYTLAVPIVGIVKAVRRKDRGARSFGAVVWSAINIGLFGLLGLASAVGHHPVVIQAIGLALNGVWLSLAIRANRAAARSTP